MRRYLSTFPWRSLRRRRANRPGQEQVTNREGPSQDAREGGRHKEAQKNEGEQEEEKEKEEAGEILVETTYKIKRDRGVSTGCQLLREEDPQKETH